MSEYPYMCTYCDTVEEANESEYGWIHWNGVAMTKPKWVKHSDGKIYSGEEWYEVIVREDEDASRILKDVPDAIDFLVKHAKDANWDCVQKAHKTLIEGFKKADNNDDA